MQHTCQDCQHSFTSEGQNEPHITPAVQCPQCHSYRTQPSGIPDEQNDITHFQMGMPTSTQDDMSGNPLQEGMMGGWKDKSVRDESFGGGTYSYKISLFETPEFETTEIVAPPDLYRHGMETEAAHRANIQLPKGITDNLHAALGNLGAWVENPYENGELRPYYNKYWKTIRPSFMKPSSLQIGVADPTMAEIINHVAQTDDLTPLYEYRGKTSALKTAGPLIALAPEAIAGLTEGAGIAGADFAGAGAGIGAGDAAAGAAAADATAGAGGAGSVVGPAAEAGAAQTAENASTASGIGGIMQKFVKGLPGGAGAGVGADVAQKAIGMGGHYLDDLLGAGMTPQMPQMQSQPTSFYARTASDEDDAFPGSHDEIPKNKDGDSKEKSDGNSHEWQRDLSVNDIGGTDHSPAFDPAGPAFQRFMMMIPLLMQYTESGEDASQDPLIHGLHQSLDSEIPGYLDHADDNAGHHLLMMIKGGPKAEPEKNEPTHIDENSGGKHESKVASLNGEAAEFLPSFEVTPPSLRGAAMYPHAPSEIPNGVLHGPVHPEDEMLFTDAWPQSKLENCPHCGSYGKTALGLCPGCGQEVYPHGQGQAQAYDHMTAKTADTQGPQTPEQIKAVQKWLLQHGQSMGLEGDELMETILSVPTNPLEFADILAKIQQTEPPPASPDQGGLSATPPMPAQENAPPSATMPVPPMGAQGQMMSAVRRYAADSIADVCPECGGHTTELLDEDGNSHCHSCNNFFKTDKGIPDKVHPGNTTASTWNVDEDFRKEAADTAVMDHPGTSDVTHMDQAGDTTFPTEWTHNPEQGGHTWKDEEGNPLKVGQEYEMYTGSFDIPDHVRIEAVKPSSVVLTYINPDIGIEHSDEITKKEANLEQTRFKSTDSAGEIGPEDDGSLEQNNDDNTGYTGPGARDLSQPDSVVSNIIASGVDEENPNLAWLMAGVPKTAGANYTPMEQRALIEESGMARNADRLDLLGTHYVQDADEDQYIFGW